MSIMAALSPIDFNLRFRESFFNPRSVSSHTHLNGPCNYFIELIQSHLIRCVITILSVKGE